MLYAQNYSPDFLKFIDQIFYINLDKRTDRRAEIEQELHNIGFPPELVSRFAAIEDPIGFIGCSKSHLEVLKIARDRNYENILIFEDDFKFTITKEIFHANMDEFFEKYREKFDVLMLSYNLKEGEPIDDLIGYCRKAQTASGYIVHKRILDVLIATMEGALEKLIETHKHWLYVNDVCWFSLQQTREWYYLMERAGIQRPGYSDLSNQFVNHRC